MRKGSARFFQVVIVLIGCGSLALLLWEPHLEGRNAHSTVFQIYFHDPFLAYAYTASIAFFVTIYQALRLLGCAGRGEVSSERSARALRTIKYCGMVLVGSLLGAEAYFLIARRGKDDIAGGVMMGLFFIVVFAVVTIVAVVYEKALRRDVDLKPGKL